MPLAPPCYDPVATTLAAYDGAADFYTARWDAYVPAPGALDLVELLTSQLPAGARILDVGCGSGRDLRRMRQAGFDATGLDASIELAARARRFGPVVVADARKLPFDDHTFDAVLASASLLHLPYADVGEAIGHIARVLRVDGLLTVSVKAGSGTFTDADGRFFQLYDDDMLDQLLADAGFLCASAYTDTSDTRTGTVWLVRDAVR